VAERTRRKRDEGPIARIRGLLKSLSTGFNLNMKQYKVKHLVRMKQ